MTNGSQIWDGTTERRDHYCPVHHNECKELESTGKDVKKMVPIWVFLLFIAVSSSVVGYQLTLLNSHVKTSNKVLSSVIHGLNEVALNQRRVMAKIGLKFHDIPRYNN